MPFLTDAEIIAGADVRTREEHQRVIQSTHVLFIQVDLSSEITIGRAILTAIEADASLRAVIDALLPGWNEKTILANITAVAFVEPGSNVTLYTYSGAATHNRIAKAGEITYIPSAQPWRLLAAGPAATKLDVLISV